MPTDTKQRKGLPTMEAFIKLCRWEHEFLDHSHQVVLMKTVADMLELDMEERLWLSILGTAYSHEGSTWTAWKSPGVRQRQKFPPEGLPITVLRRNLLGGKINRHFKDVYEIKSIYKWLRPHLQSWEALISHLRTLWGNGAWAAYTTADVMRAVADIPVKPDEYGFLTSSGPRAGMVTLGLPVTEDGVKKLVRILEKHDVRMPIQCLETIMCYWQNLIKGKFYIGRSIDRQQTQINWAVQRGTICNTLWQARKTAFNNKILGELNGWPGLDKQRLKHYFKTGKLLLPWEGRA